MKNKPITILFDANPLVNGNKSGVGYYTFNLIEALANNFPEEVNLVGHYFNFLGKKNGAILPRNENIIYKESRILPGKILSFSRKIGINIPFEVFFRQKGDVALFTNFVSQPSLFGTPTIVAVHDLCYEDVPEYVSDKNRIFLHKFVPKSINRASLIITISKFTKLSIEQFYPIKGKSILITPIPPPLPKRAKIDILKHFQLQRNYILFVGNLEPRKNFVNLVKAYELLPENIKNSYSLVLVGGKGWKIDSDIQYIEQSQKTNKNIILTGYVSDEQKAALYSNASLYVQPSHYEGFGMPILEAMSYGVPTAVSDIDVFHEVSGNASIYFDKDKPASIAQTLNNILNDKKLSEKLRVLASERLKNYKWEEVANSLHQAILQTIASKKKL